MLEYLPSRRGKSRRYRTAWARGRDDHKIKPLTLRVRIPTAEGGQEPIEAAADEELEAVHTRVRIPEGQEPIGIA